MERVTEAGHGHLAMLTFSALVAGSFSLGALAANHISPLALTAPRFALAAALVGSVALMSGQLDRSALKSPWRYLLLGSVFAAYFVLMFEGLKTAPPVSAAAVFTLVPPMAALFGWVLLRQKPTKRMVLALTLGGIGAIWVIFRADWQALRGFRPGSGELTYFWGCVAHAVYVPLVRLLNRGEAAVTFTFGTLVAGALVLTVVGWDDIRTTDWARLPAIVWITLVYVAVFASAATFVLVQFATLRLPSAKVMAYTYLTPSWVILWEIALGNHAPPLLVLTGIALTILALFLMMKDET
ncbi:MAG: EamA family transporter [Rhodobacterales bacterium]|nr:MAG: EamA family transporter [Rhodobacterales bacterium]